MDEHPLDGLTRAVADRYRFDGEIGRGGMATVHLAHDLKHERRVAIKVLRPELAASLGSERFLREIKITARLNHPHILPLLDSGDANGTLYYVMPFVEGESLRDRLDREKQLPVEDAVRVVREVLDGLEYAHRHDVIHRDVKPENVLLEEGHSAVADFGIARAITLAGEGKLTATGVVVGTPEYMSPEQAAGDASIDARSDIYAVGCLLYEMLAGQPPFTGATTHSVIRQHLVADARPITDIRAGVPTPIVAALERALAKTPADRFASARAFAEALADTTPLVTRVSATRRWVARNRRAAVATLAAGVVGAVVLVATLPAHNVVGLPKVAVLPLRSIGDTADSYFGQALHENLVARIAMIPGLAVTSRATVLGYHGTDTSTKAIGKDLGVDFILEGNVQRNAERIDVSVQLIDVHNGTRLWSQSYPMDRSVASQIDIQADIARRLSNELQVRIGAAVRGRISDRPTKSADAYELFLRASQLPWPMDPAANRASEALLKQARAMDPRFAEATAALAQVYWSRTYVLKQPREWADSGLALAQSAVKSDSTAFAAYDALASNHLALGHLEQARAARLKVRELQPSDGQAMLHLGWLAYLQGRLDEAVAFWADARAVDPINPTVPGDMVFIELLFGDVGRATRWNEVRRALPVRDPYGGGNDVRVLFWQGKTVEGLRRAEQKLRDNPSDAELRRMLAAAAISSGNLESARQHLEELDRASPNGWSYWGTTHRTSYAYVLSELGERARARDLLERTLRDAMHLVNEGDERPGVRREIAAIHAALGEREAAYGWLAKAIDAGWRLEALEPSPLFHSLRAEPRFQALMQRIDADIARARQRVRSEKLGPKLPGD